MKHPKNYKTILAACTWCLSLIPSWAFASAWTRPQGDLFVLSPISYTTADESFDKNGERVDRNQFEMMEFSPLIEYGVTDYLTVGMQPKYRYVTLNTGAGELTNSGLAETDIFVRQRLWSHDQASLSIQGGVKIPIDPQEDSELAIGRDQQDATIKLAFGNRHYARSGRIFYSADLGYRKRWEVAADQVSANAFIGWAPGGSSWSLILRSANTMSVENKETEKEVLTTFPEYTRHDVQLMLSYRFSNTMSLVGGVSTTYAGENVGIGNTAFLALSLPISF